MSLELTQLKNILEAVLLVAEDPLGMESLLALFPEDPPSKQDIKEALLLLHGDYADRGIELVEVSSGYRIQTRSEFSTWVSRLWEEKPIRYSRAFLETLALIIYRQPITRAEIEEIRGVTVSSTIVKSLQERGWVRVVGHKDVPGKPELLATTRDFLDYFNLQSLDELPSLHEIQDMEKAAREIEQRLPDLFETPEGAGGVDSQGGDAESPEQESAHSEMKNAAVTDGDTEPKHADGDSTHEATDAWQDTQSAWLDQRDSWHPMSDAPPVSPGWDEQDDTQTGNAPEWSATSEESMPPLEEEPSAAAGDAYANDAGNNETMPAEVHAPFTESAANTMDEAMAPLSGDCMGEAIRRDAACDAGQQPPEMMSADRMDAEEEDEPSRDRIAFKPFGSDNKGSAPNGDNAQGNTLPGASPFSDDDLTTGLDAEHASQTHHAAAEHMMDAEDEDAPALDANESSLLEFGGGDELEDETKDAAPFSEDDLDADLLVIRPSEPALDYSRGNGDRGAFEESMLEHNEANNTRYAHANTVGDATLDDEDDKDKPAAP